MSRYDYEASREIARDDVPFNALIMAAISRADSTNLAKLCAAWPDVWAELDARYNAPGGRFPTDPPKRTSVTALGDATDEYLEAASAANRAAVACASGDPDLAAVHHRRLAEHVGSAARTLGLDGPAPDEVTDADVDAADDAYSVETDDALRAVWAWLKTAGKDWSGIDLRQNSLGRVYVQVVPDDVKALGQLRTLAARFGVSPTERFPGDVQAATVDVTTTVGGVQVTAWSWIEDPAVLAEARAWIAEAELETTPQTEDETSVR